LVANLKKGDLVCVVGRISPQCSSTVIISSSRRSNCVSIGISSSIRSSGSSSSSRRRRRRRSSSSSSSRHFKDFGMVCICLRSRVVSCRMSDACSAHPVLTPSPRGFFLLPPFLHRTSSFLRNSYVSHAFLHLPVLEKRVNDARKSGLDENMEVCPSCVVVAL
jgi:hypothetical protein